MNNNCDTETGICTPSELKPLNVQQSNYPNTEIIYIGDPMCSWCYGIAPELKLLKEHYEEKGIPFKIIVGGLRPGGSDEWNHEFKSFLKDHWIEIEERTRQPFGFKLLELDSFNYDTEPSCRAFVTAQKWLSNKSKLSFFEAIQEKFYYQSEDPTKVEFYESICKDYKIPFTEFKNNFLSKALKEQTYNEFALNRSWGVRAYPTILLSTQEVKHTISRGYSDFNTLKNSIDTILNK